MTTYFYDRQDEANPMNGRAIADSTQLRQLLESVHGRPPFFAELVGENGYKLLVGLARAEGCVQFSANDGSTPCLMAVGFEASDAGEVSFLIGDTPSPVPKRYCLPYADVVRVAATFVDTGERDAGVAWEEV